MPSILLFELLKDAFHSLARHKLRTILTMLGMIFGVAAVLGMLSIGAGAEQQALALIEKMGLSNIVVRSKEFDREQLEILRQDSAGLTLRDVRALQKTLPDGTLILGKKQLKTYQIASVVGKADSSVLGVSSLYPQVLDLEMVEGSFFFPVDEELGQQVCVLGTTARRKLFGLNPAVGESVKINQEWFTVIGVLSDQLLEAEQFEGIKIENTNNNIYIPLGTLLRKFERDAVESELDEVIIHLLPGEDVREQSALVSSLMAQLHGLIDDFTLIVPERLLSQRRQTQRIFNIVMGAIASISLVVGGIGIMNIMLASVLERTNEIGLRRAVGARRRDVSRQFIMEAIAISVSGAAVGMALGYGISHLVSVYSGWPTVITPISLMLSVGVSVTVGLIFGIYPAKKAALISPMEALRYE